MGFERYRALISKTEVPAITRTTGHTEWTDRYRSFASIFWKIFHSSCRTISDQVFLCNWLTRVVGIDGDNAGIAVKSSMTSHERNCITFTRIRLSILPSGQTNARWKSRWKFWEFPDVRLANEFRVFSSVFRSKRHARVLLLEKTRTIGSSFVQRTKEIFIFLDSLRQSGGKIVRLQISVRENCNYPR